MSLNLEAAHLSPMRRPFDFGLKVGSTGHCMIGEIVVLVQTHFEVLFMSHLLLLISRITQGQSILPSMLQNKWTTRYQSAQKWKAVKVAL